VDKRADYAEVGILEYWIVNPLDETVTVLRLDGKQYAEHGVFQRGATATSLLADWGGRGGGRRVRRDIMSCQLIAARIAAGCS